MRNFLIVLVVIGILIFVQQPTPIKPVDTPLAEFSASAADNLPQQEKDAIAAHLRAIADEIDTLVDPLSTSTLNKPADAIAKIHSVLILGSPGWANFANSLNLYFIEQDKRDEAQGHPDRTIYQIGQQFREIANGLSPLRAEEFEAGEVEDIESAYMNGDLTGVYLDDPSQPEEYREIAKQDEASFFGLTQNLGDFPNFAGEGKGKRAVYYNYAYRINPNAFRLRQISGNCVFASASTICTVLNGVNTFLMRLPNAFEAEGSTAFYAFRGHAGAGSSPARAAWAYLEYGYPLMKDYGNGFDLRDSITDQKVGISNWSNPEKSLAELIKITKETPIGKIEKLPAQISEDALNDLLYQGCCIHFGGTLIGSKNGDPISSVGGVGPHAMSVIGYDDTQEFRDFYKSATGKTLTESVYIFDNTWGETPQYVAKNWFPKWGKQTGGTYVLKYSDAIRLLRNAYVWYPNLRGVTPAQFNWSLAKATR